MRAEVPTASFETARLNKLDELGLAGPAFDSQLQPVVALLAKSIGVPIALVSIVGEDRQWFRARTGLDLEGTPRDEAFCNHCIKQDDIFVVTDAAADARFADFPIVTGQHAVRFYAGAPIVVDGQVLGSVCVLDRKSREFGEPEHKLLQDAAVVIADTLKASSAGHMVDGDTAGNGDALEAEFHELIRSDADAFRFFHDFALDGVWYRDLDFPERHWVSPRFKEVFGYEEHEMGNLRDWWRQAIHPEDLETALGNFENHLEDPAKPYVQDARYRHRDGSTVWIRCRGLIIRDSTGKPRRMIGSHTDITNLKNLEHSATERARLMTAILDAANEGIMLFEGVWNGQGQVEDLVFREANPASLAITGRSRDELIGARLSETFPGNFETGIFLHYKRALETMEPVQFEIHYQHEGLDHWFMVRAAPSSKRLLVVTFVDISALKRANVELERRSAEMRFILDTIPVRVWLKDLEGKILRLNKAAADSVSMPLDQVEGVSASELMPDSFERYLIEDRRVVETGEPIRGLLERFDAIESHKGWVRTDKYPLPGELGHGQGVIVVSVDVTNEQTALNNLEIANSSLKQFASLASHDLQAPLRQITFLADFLVEDHADEMSSEAVETVLRIQKIAGTMRTLVRDLLSFSSDPISQDNLEPVPIRELLEAVARELEPDLSEQQAELSVKLPAVKVLATNTILRQVMLNLIGNSLKFRSEATPIVAVKGRKRGSMLEIVVEDNGIGLKPELHDTAFRLFGRAHHKAVSGNGIGLAFCRKAVTAFGGTISIDPDYEKGCRVIMSLAVV